MREINSEVNMAVVSKRCHRGDFYLVTGFSDPISVESKLLKMARKLLENNCFLASFADLSQGKRVVAELFADDLTAEDLETHAVISGDALEGTDGNYKLLLLKGDGSKLTDFFEGSIGQVIAALKKNNYIPFNTSRIVQIVKY